MFALYDRHYTYWTLNYLLRSFDTHIRKMRKCQLTHRHWMRAKLANTKYWEGFYTIRRVDLRTVWKKTDNKIKLKKITKQFSAMQCNELLVFGNGQIYLNKLTKAQKWNFFQTKCKYPHAFSYASHGTFNFSFQFFFFENESVEFFYMYAHVMSLFLNDNNKFSKKVTQTIAATIHNLNETMLIWIWITSFT